MSSKKTGGRIIINLSTPEIKNLPESLDNTKTSSESMVESLFGSIAKDPETSYTIHIVLFNSYKQHDWGYLKFYLEKNNDMYHLPSIQTTFETNDNIEDAIKDVIFDSYAGIEVEQIKQIFQDKENLYVFIDDKEMNSIRSDNQRWFISSEMEEPYIHESCSNVMKYETTIYNALSNANTEFYSSSYIYICNLENGKYTNVLRGHTNHNEMHPIIEHNIVGRTHIFSTTPLSSSDNEIRTYVYPTNKSNNHILNDIDENIYSTLKDTSLITFNENDIKFVSIKPRNLFIET
jgi:hypothetical protein